MVAGDAVLQGTHNSHGADTDDQGGGDETIHKAVVVAAAGQLLELFAQGVQAAFNVDPFADEGAEDAEGEAVDTADTPAEE